MKRPVLTSMLILIVLASFFVNPVRDAAAQGSTPTSVGIFEALEIAPGTLIEVPVAIKNAQNVYAADIEIQFDPDILTPQDADPSSEGIQLGFGQFLDAGMVLFNEVDFDKGTARFAVSQVNPSEAKSGSGILFVLYFEAARTGESPLTLTNLQLATREGTEIPSEAVNSTLKVITGAAPITATAIALQDTTNLIVLPTPGPSPTPTLAATTAPTLAPTGKVAAPNQPEAETGNPSAPQPAGVNAEKPFLVQNWWIVLIVLALVVYTGIYLMKTRKPTQ